MNTPSPPLSAQACAAVAPAVAGSALDLPESSYRALFAYNPLPMWVYHRQTLGMLAANPAALALYGYSQQEFLGLTLDDLHLGAAPLPATEEPGAVWQHRQRDGTQMAVELVTEALLLDGVPACLVQVRDVTAQRRAGQSHQELARRLSTTLESITDAFFTLDRAWCFTYVNAQAEKLLRAPAAQLIGFNVWDKFPQALGTTFQREYERAMAENCKTRFESFYAPWSVWLAVDAYPSAQGLAVYFRDVTEKHLAEQRLIEERETLATVLNAASDAIISVDEQGLIKLFNPGAERIFGRSSQSVQDQLIELLMPERFRSAHPAQRGRFLQSGETERMMGLGLVKGLRADGREIDLEGSISRVTIQGQRRLIISMRDVTERVAAQAEFQQSKAQLSRLTHKLMTQEKTLVKRLAQVLHDQLGQTMAALRMCHETILTLQSDGGARDTERLQAQMGTLIAQAIRQVRQVLVDLRPPLLDEQGLVAALDNELRNRSQVHPQIDISIHVPPAMDAQRWPLEVEYAAFMIAREAVENALRHSGASWLTVRLSGHARALQMEVADNGVGMASSAPQAGHLGILGMQERAQAVGALVTLSAGQHEGTRVGFNWQATP